MATTKPLPSIEYLRECFEYVDGTLIWKERPKHHFKSNNQCDKVNRDHAGSEAGCLMFDGFGYRYTVKVNRIIYKRYHIIFAIINGRTVEKIDHKDGVSTNDKIDNLREATHSQNIMNAKISSRNKSGYKGVSYNKKERKYVSSITINGKYIYLGNFSDPKLAHKAYCDAASKYFGEFARTK